MASLLVFTIFLVANFVSILNEVPHWEALNIGIIRSKQINHLSSIILDGLRSAIIEMQSFINIWYLPGDNKLSAKNLTLCILHGNQLFTEYFIETINNREKLIPFDTTKDVNLKFYDINFLLFLQADLQKCNTNDGLLASTVPCALIASPAAARLILCPVKERWNSFHAITDLFRHEIMHALGFGLITPGKNLSSIPTTRKFFWTDESSNQHVTSTYMDFQDNALIEARKHFNCKNLNGIEADDDNKIHLNEYIYGNELMTPILSNGRNYLTKISASILEATKDGDKQWYKTNESLVQAETNAYWYGRNWGCIFAQRSCYEYIVNRLSYRNTTFPFCNPIDLVDKHYVDIKRVCFSNGTLFTMVPMSCNLFSEVRTSKIAFGLRARKLANQFKMLSKSQFGNFYGSDGTHRYCPFAQEVLFDRITEIPDNAEIIACDSTHAIQIQNL